MIRVVHPGSRIPDPGFRIPDPDADFLPSRIPDPGVKKVPNPGSRIRIRNTDSCLYFYVYVLISVSWMCAQVGGKDHVHCLLPPLESLATVEETIVRDKVR